MSEEEIDVLDGEEEEEGMWDDEDESLFGDD